jgi:predicted nucleic acid-binding protein
MTGSVFDASVLLRPVLGEPGWQESERVFAAAKVAHAPDWVLAECANALWKATIRGAITTTTALDRLRGISRLDIELHEGAGLLPAALSLAADLRHPVYDCLYIALAIAEDADLVTADARMRDTAEAAGLGERVVWVEDA